VARPRLSAGRPQQQPGTPVATAVELVGGAVARIQGPRHDRGQMGARHPTPRRQFLAAKLAETPIADALQESVGGLAAGHPASPVKRRHQHLKPATVRASSFPAGGQQHTCPGAEKAVRGQPAVTPPAERRRIPVNLGGSATVPAGSTPRRPKTHYRLRSERPTREGGLGRAAYIGHDSGRNGRRTRNRHRFSGVAQRQSVGTTREQAPRRCPLGRPKDAVSRPATATPIRRRRRQGRNRGHCQASARLRWCASSTVHRLPPRSSRDLPGAGTQGS
jgi:hypothetical protein